MVTTARPARRQKPGYVKPDKAYIEGLLGELQAIYSEQDEQIRRLRRVRDLTQPVALDPKYRLVDVEVRDPTITDEIQRQAASLSVNEPSCHVTPSGKGDKAETNATKREKFSEAMFRVCGRRTPGRDTFSELVDGAIGDGGAWGKLLFTRDLWDERYKLRLSDYEKEALADVNEDRERVDDDEADEYADEIEGDSDRKAEARSNRLRALGEEPGEVKAKRLGSKRFTKATEDKKKEAGPPFTWVACDALTVYPVWTGNRLSEVLEITQRPQLATFRQYRLRRNGDGDIVPDELMQGTNKDDSSSSSTVEFIEHWDDKYVSYLVAGKNKQGKDTTTLVDQWPHHYGRVPYFFAPGIVMSHWRNRKVGWSIGEAKRWLVEYRSFLWTLHAQVAARDALGPIQKRRAPDAPIVKPEKGTPKDQQNWGLREILEAGPGEEYVPLVFPDVAKSLMEQIGMVSDAIERLESPRIRSEIGGGLEGAGFAINQVLAEAKIRFDPIARSIERMYEEATRFAWTLIRKLVRETVWVQREGDDSGYLSASPDDLEDVVGLRWELDPERPSAKLIEARYWHERLKAGTAHNAQAIEAMGDNPDEIRQGQAMDRIRQTEWYLKYQEMLVLQEVGKGDLMLFAQRAQYVAQTGGMPGLGGQMGGPNGTPGGMGNGMVPDMGNAAMAPNGAGASPVNGAVSGAGPGAVVPQAAAGAGIQQLQG